MTTTSTLAKILANGVWYRRLTGAMYSARLFEVTKDRPIEFVQVCELHPNTLEEIWPPSTMKVENFFCFYCRKEQLARAA